MEWRQKINAIIILDNDHQFKQDPEYGRMLKKMWEGDLDLEDRKKLMLECLDTTDLNFHQCYKVSIKLFRL